MRQLVETHVPPRALEERHAAVSGAVYEVRLATGGRDIRAAQALRFAVFNLELNEGLEGSYHTCLDADPFDAVCDHLLVEEKTTGEVVGTYRLQSGAHALRHLGFYSAQEFAFEPFLPLVPELLELGRACVHRQHRNLIVLRLLWRGIAAYARHCGARYLVGCSSLTSQDPAAGASVYSHLIRHHLAAPRLQTRPRPGWACPLDRLLAGTPEVPKLLAAYLALGARICGPPALDREFKTIDFLTVLDLEALPPRAVQRFLR
jgi:putative hemolysin